MKITCPCCGDQFPIEAAFQDDDGKRLAALFADVEPKLGRAVLNYLRLFSTAKRGLRLSKAVRLVEDLLVLVKAGSVTKDARTNDRKPATPAMWGQGIEQVLGQRERLTLPFDNHHYLRAVVWGIASDPSAMPVSIDKASTGINRHQDIQERVGRIRADVMLGILSADDGERQIAEITGVRRSGG